MHYFIRVKKFLVVVFVLAVFVMGIRYISEVRLKTIVTTVNEEQGDSHGDGYIIEDVPHIYQMEIYPTGCESVAAVSLMQYYNIDITVDEFIDCYLQKADAPYYEDGILKGESPWKYFIGNPRSEHGLGCYATVIEKAVNEICSGSCDIKVLTDANLEDITKNYVVNGIPVMIWATIGMMEPCEGDSWELPDGEIFTFIRPEHALLLVGYDADNYYFSDSMVDNQVVAYKRSDCERAFNAMGRQAIVVMP